MSECRYQLKRELYLAGRGKVEVSVDDDFPPAEHPVSISVDDGYKILTVDQADELGRALIGAAQEARVRQEKADEQQVTCSDCGVTEYTGYHVCPPRD